LKLLDGKKLADKIKNEVKDTVRQMNDNGQNICLAVIQVGNDVASSTYVKNKQNACNYVGIHSVTYKMDDVSEEKLIGLIEELNNDKKVNGILVQLPLPENIDEYKVIQSIAPEKDVDGFHELNMGKLVTGNDTFVPCTTKGIIELLIQNNIKIEGMNCVVVGRSNIVGKPTAIELIRNNGTVTVCHSKTNGLKQICREADILICAIGKPRFFTREYISPNTVVIDVGIHRQRDGSLCGDVNYDEVKDIVSAITPVPRGVGSMTVAMLMQNCVQAAKMQYDLL
jgi:methylenetetrahydrofolate dehydrogenase (NADP+)/methenyltetrahydrofolate cyclohydrolase